MPNKRPPLIIFSISDPPDLIRAPPFISFEENEIFYELFGIFPFFAGTIQAHFQGKIALFCMYFSFLLYDKRGGGWKNFQKLIGKGDGN